MAGGRGDVLSHRIVIEIDRARSVTFDRACRAGKKSLISYSYVVTRGNLSDGNVTAYESLLLCRTLRKGIASHATAMVMMVDAIGGSIGGIQRRRATHPL